MTCHIPRPSAPPCTLLRAIEEAHYHSNSSSGEYTLYRKPCLHAKTAHRDVLAATACSPHFVMYCRGQSPWVALWARIAVVIGEPADLGSVHGPKSDRVKASTWKGKRRWITKDAS